MSFHWFYINDAQRHTGDCFLTPVVSFSHTIITLIIDHNEIKWTRREKESQYYSNPSNGSILRDDIKVASAVYEQD